MISDLESGETSRCRVVFFPRSAPPSAESSTLPGGDMVRTLNTGKQTLRVLNSLNSAFFCSSKGWPFRFCSR